MRAQVTFRTQVPAADMTRDQAATWLLGSMTSDAPVSGFAALAVSAGVSGMLSQLTEAHDTDKRLSVTTGHGAEKWQLGCTRTGGMFRRVYHYSAQRVY